MRRQVSSVGGVEVKRHSIGHRPIVRALTAILCASLLVASACAPSGRPAPTATPSPRPTDAPPPTLEPTVVPLPTDTPGQPQVATVEGLVMRDDSQLVIGVNWLSRSRASYVVQGGDVEAVLKFLGETARVTGEVVERGPWLKEIVVRSAEPSQAPDRLALRRGFIKELGVSIYMQGTHVLVDREGKMICLLQAKKSGIDLDAQMMKGEVTVIGVMNRTVEGNAQIMEVELVEAAK